VFRLEEAKRLRRRVLLTLLILPILIAGLVLAGVFAGFYVANIYKSTSILFPLLFSSIGFAASLILSYFIAKRVAATPAAKEEK
jgi:hypothetical protein